MSGPLRLLQPYTFVCNILRTGKCIAGKLEVQVGKSKQKKIFGITRAHLEEDAGMIWRVAKHQTHTQQVQLHVLALLRRGLHA